MKVYLLTSGEYGDYRVQGAFASIEDAEKAKLLWGLEDDDSAQVEELEVLTIPELPKLEKRLPFKVFIYPEGMIFVHKGWYDQTSFEESYTFEKESQKYTFYLFAVDEQDAKKKAKERLLSL